MSNSFERDGTEERNCAGPLGQQFVPNVFCGTSVDDSVVIASYFPLVTIGTSDLSFEFWFKNALGGVGNSDVSSIVGFVDDRASVTALAALDEDDAIWNPPGGTFAFVSKTQNVRGWHYWTVNFDRSANMELFLDGTSLGTASIAADVALDVGARPWGPLVSLDFIGGTVPGFGAFDLPASTDPGGDFPESLTDPFTDFSFPHMFGVLGPIALHVGGSPLLTAANMASAMANRDVNEFGSGTEIIYRWKNIEFDDDPSWDFNKRHGMRGYTDYPTMQLGMARGADGSVRVPNAAAGATVAEALGLQTVETYGQNSNFDPVPADGMRGWAPLGADQFFTQGGSVPPGL